MSTQTNYINTNVFAWTIIVLLGLIGAIFFYTDSRLNEIDPSNFTGLTKGSYAMTACEEGGEDTCYLARGLVNKTDFDELAGTVTADVDGIFFDGDRRAPVFFDECDVKVQNWDSLSVCEGEDSAWTIYTINPGMRLSGY